MEDFCYAGGIPAVMDQIKSFIKPANTILNKDILITLMRQKFLMKMLLRLLINRLSPSAGLKVLRGNLAPNGAIIKPAAASEESIKS